MREPCCMVSLTGIGKNDGHIPRGSLWLVTWLPKGYAPTMLDRLICAFPDPEGLWDDYGLSEGKRPPLIEAAVKAIEDYMRPHTSGQG